MILASTNVQYWQEAPEWHRLIYHAGMLKAKFQQISHDLLVFIIGKRHRTQNRQKLRTAVKDYVPRYQVCTATNMLEFRDGLCKTSVIGFSQRFGFSGPGRYRRDNQQTDGHPRRRRPHPGMHLPVLAFAAAPNTAGVITIGIVSFKVGTACRQDCPSDPRLDRRRRRRDGSKRRRPI